MNITQGEDTTIELDLGSQYGTTLDLTAVTTLSVKAIVYQNGVLKQRFSQGTPLPPAGHGLLTIKGTLTATDRRTIVLKVPRADTKTYISESTLAVRTEVVFQDAAFSEGRADVEEFHLGKVVKGSPDF